MALAQNMQRWLVSVGVMPQSAQKVASGMESKINRGIVLGDSESELGRMFLSAVGEQAGTGNIKWSPNWKSGPGDAMKMGPGAPGPMGAKSGAFGNGMTAQGPMGAKSGAFGNGMTGQGPMGAKSGAFGNGMTGQSPMGAKSGAFGNGMTDTARIKDLVGKIERGA